MKKDKKPDAILMLFLTGGAKIQVVTTHSKEEVTKMIMSAASPRLIKEVESEETTMLPAVNWVELDAINDNPEVEDENFCFDTRNLLFFTVTVPNDSKIIMPQEAGKIQVVN